jgi:hypothetical protein
MAGVPIVEPAEVLNVQLTVPGAAAAAEAVSNTAIQVMVIDKVTHLASLVENGIGDVLDERTLRTKCRVMGTSVKGVFILPLEACELGSKTIDTGFRHFRCRKEPC